MKYTIFTRKNIYPFFLNVLDKGYILQIAKKLLAQNVDIETISKATGLTVEEIKKL